MIQTQTMDGVPPDDGKLYGRVTWGGEPVAFLDDLSTPGPAHQIRPKVSGVTVERLPGPAADAAREAREAIERQKDREEREAAAKRAHALEVMRLTLDHNVAVRQVAGIDPCYVAWLMAGAAALASLVTGLVAAVIP